MLDTMTPQQASEAERAAEADATTNDAATDTPPPMEIATSSESVAVAGASEDSSDEASANRAEATEESTSETPKKRGRQRKQRSSDMTVTLTGSADGGDWQVDILHGSKRAVSKLAVPASSIGTAAEALAPEVSEAVETVLAAAREQQREKVEQLQAQLAAAQQALAELEHGDG